MNPWVAPALVGLLQGLILWVCSRALNRINAILEDVRELNGRLARVEEWKAADPDRQRARDREIEMLQRDMSRRLSLLERRLLQARPTDDDE